MSWWSTSLLAAKASTADAVEAASQVVKSHELSPSASVLNVVVKKKKCFAKIILKLDLNINVKCHVNVEHEGSPWGIPLDFGWYGPVLPGDTRIYQILWIIFQLDTFECLYAHCSLPKSMSISRSRIFKGKEFCETLKYWLLKSVVSPTVHGPEWPEFSAVIYNSIYHSHALWECKRKTCHNIKRSKCLRCGCRPFQEYELPARQRSGFRQSQILWKRIQYM